MIHSRDQKGFTLIELMVVIVIIGILIAIVVPNINKQADRAKEKRAIAELTLIKTIIDTYYVENGKYPKDVNGNDPDDISEVLRNNGISWGELQDPWGRAYMYDSNDTTYSKYVIYSKGPTDTSTKNCIVVTNEEEPQLNKEEPPIDGSKAAVESKYEATK